MTQFQNAPATHLEQVTAKTATPTSIRIPGMRGDARHYKLSEPIRDWDGNEYEYVIVSAVSSVWATETYIFPADEQAEVVDWSELDGSYRGGTDHAAALRNAGYEVTA